MTMQPAEAGPKSEAASADFRASVRPLAERPWRWRRSWWKALRFAALLVSAVAPAGAETAPHRPVVVELFTSEGCSSCPSADAFLGELARSRADVLPLAFHITYWDNLGWRDPYALPEATARQRAYAPMLDTGSGVYTPQMVIDGRTDAVGSDRPAVLAAIAAAARGTVVPLGIKRQAQAVSVSVGAAAGAGRLLLLGYDRQHVTAVARGENAGSRLTEANIVRSITDLGVWQGTPISRSVPAPVGETYAVILQQGDGRIIGAAACDASPAS